MPLDLTAIERAAQHAARHFVTAWSQRNRPAIERPVRNWLYCLEQSPRDPAFALAAAQGMLETDCRMDLAHAHYGREVLTMLHEGLIPRGDALPVLQKGREIRSAYVLMYRAEVGRLAAEKRLAAEQEPAPESLDARLEIRLSGDLKAWVLANGGSEMVRLLIEAERERLTP